jgi:hypothetical protein
MKSFALEVKFSSPLQAHPCHFLSILTSFLPLTKAP